MSQIRTCKLYRLFRTNLLHNAKKYTFYQEAGDLIVKIKYDCACKIQILMS